jgi:hypothetical protein
VFEKVLAKTKEEESSKATNSSSKRPKSQNPFKKHAPHFRYDGIKESALCFKDLD